MYIHTHIFSLQYTPDDDLKCVLVSFNRDKNQKIILVFCFPEWYLTMISHSHPLTNHVIGICSKFSFQSNFLEMANKQIIAYSDEIIWRSQSFPKPSSSPGRPSNPRPPRSCPRYKILQKPALSLNLQDSTVVTRPDQ